VEPDTTPSAEPDAAGETGVPRERLAAPAFSAHNLRPLYVSPRGLARCAKAGLVLSTVVTWLALGMHLAHVRQLRFALAGTGDPQQLKGIASALATVQGIQFGIYALTAVFFLAWLYRLRINVRALGMRKLGFARHWSVVGFLIPLLNAVRPYQVMAEIWRASDPALLDPFEWKSLEPPPLLAFWWATFVFAVTLELAAFGFAITAGVPPFESLIASGVAIVADLAAALSASIAWFVVTRLTDTQMAKRERLRLEAPHA
jgi:hypothetical protein